MPHWVPSWQLAMTVAGSLGFVAASVRIWLRQPSTPPRPRVAVAALLGWEVAILIFLYGMWQLAGSLALIGTNDGLDRGRGLWDLERRLHLPNEAGFQSAFLPHHTLIRFFNLYYVVAHYNVLLIMLAWLFWRHRNHYREARRVIGLATFACLAVQLIPVAPPRLVGGHGIVDTALQYGQSVYGPVGQGFSDQYSAMPSVHIAWASAVAFFVWRNTTSRWRYLAVAHWLLTWVVVIATGNHYWLDGVVAVAILAMSFWTVRLITYLAGLVPEWVRWRSAPVGVPGLSPELSSSSPPDVAAVPVPAASPPRAPLPPQRR